jgi:hypothetical protein
MRGNGAARHRLGFRSMSRPLDYREERALIDLCECPGLFAGQYSDLDLLPAGYVERVYRGAGGFMGLAKAYPSDAARDHYAEITE